jgi:tetratricopeptide (TPR) repeat protein
MSNLGVKLEEALGRALAALQHDRPDDAAAIADAWLKNAPNDAAMLQMSATIALRRARFVESEAAASASLAVRPDHFPALCIAGRAARGSGAYDRAKVWFRKALALRKDDRDTSFQLALAEIESADPVTASTLDLLTQRFPTAVENWREIGKALTKAGDLDRADAAYARVLEATADYASAMSLGIVRLMRNRAAEAIAPLRLALELAPQRHEPLLPLAQALRQIGAPLEARALLDRFLETNASIAVAHYTLGLIHDDLREPQEAVAAYRRATELDPSMAEAHVNLGVALQQLHELDAAMIAYRTAMHLQPNTFARISQALPSAAKGVLWLNARRLREELLNGRGS